MYFVFGGVGLGRGEMKNDIPHKKSEKVLFKLFLLFEMVFI